MARGRRKESERVTEKKKEERRRDGEILCGTEQAKRKKSEGGD